MMKFLLTLYFHGTMNYNWPLHCVSWINPNLHMATIYLVFLKKNIYQSKNKTVCKATRHVQSKTQTNCLNKRFNMSYHFISYSG